ncbi:serine protease [Sorangium cellulosum]|uniref:Serine protease n=1 Tax=Sorangium cellulosum TaxID=56 RepID=A0A2L0F082_SORCE|nr:S8 family serine peptidase [Sorangium cellulosum]AUX44889.1 serine protease [Sorangium cellulosum]
MTAPAPAGPRGGADGGGGGAPGASERAGAGVRVALIDSGVDAAHPALRGAALRHVALVRRGGGHEVLPVEPGDLGGHGTACAGILHRMAPGAEITSVRAFGEDGRCSRDGLIAALRFCVRERFSVVNLSLGIDIPRSAPLRPGDHRSIVELYEVADAAYTAEVVLVAAGPNVAAFRTYPGRFKSLIGVGRAPFRDPEALRSELTLDHEILAPGDEVLAPAPGGGERRWTGTSFAAPHVTAHVARLRAARPELSIEAVKAALHEIARGAERSARGAEQSADAAAAGARPSAAAADHPEEGRAPA